MEIKLLFLFISVATALQCMNENNNPVDWFVVYKYPTIKTLGNLFETGEAYGYLTSADFKSWKLSTISINSSSSIIGNTLKDLYNNNNNTFYVVYNDQPPDSYPDAKKGHNKGVVLANKVGGLWLVHSAPHFPKLGSYIYPKSSSVYGQSFLCISLDLTNLDKVGNQLQYNQPQIYEKNILQNLKSSLPQLTKAANNITNNVAPWSHIMNIFSKQGTSFTSFAKSGQFNEELYEDLVAPYLQSDLYVETWPNGPGKLKSNCTGKFKVNNIVNVTFKNINVNFTTTADHSKWAVSSPSSKKSWICVGDINRMEHQKLRGGGTVCLNNKQVASDYQKVVASIEQCTKINQ